MSARLSAATRRILELMSDGAWHTAQEILDTAQQREGLRRMRELRGSHGIERRGGELVREHEYRLVRRTPEG